MMFGAAHYWLVRKGFYFSAAGGEFPIVWGVMLLVQCLLGDGVWAARASTFPLPPLWRRRVFGRA
jgi:putative oxidoreductase